MIVVALMWPIASEYFAVHRRYGLARGLGDIVTLSADVTSIATASPLSLLWGWTSTWNGPERQLFPGWTIMILAIAGLVTALRADRVARAAAGRSRTTRIFIGTGTGVRPGGRQRLVLRTVAPPGHFRRYTRQALFAGDSLLAGRDWRRTVRCAARFVGSRFSPSSCSRLSSCSCSPSARVRGSLASSFSTSHRTRG